MRTLYLDCGMGAAGDMLTAALLELFPNPDELIQELNALGIPGVKFQKERAVKCGITGTHITVTVHGEEEESHDHNGHEHGHHDHEHQDSEHGHHDHEHRDSEHDHHHDHDHGDSEHDHLHDHEHRDPEHDHHHDHDHGYRDPEHGHHDHEHGDSEHDHHHGHGHAHHHSTLRDVEHIVRGHLSLPKKVQDDVMAVYGLIAEAESHAHGVPVTEIHFHEVGTMDAIADVAAVCMLLDRLSPGEIVVSPVHVGSGQVKCAHGILPVPAPATAYILQDVPIYGGTVRGELCTPTGAALLKHFATRFGSMPIMKTQSIGYGMGKKDFEAANCVRAMLGEREDRMNAMLELSCNVEDRTDTALELSCDVDDRADAMLELSCNVDDMTGEAMGFAMERLFEAGAVDVYTIPIGMKKNRPGILLRVMCREADREGIVQAIFRHTTTIGIREHFLKRHVLERRMETVETTYGPVRRKISSGYGVERKKYEFEDLARIAKENGLSLGEVLDKIEKK